MIRLFAACACLALVPFFAAATELTLPAAARHLSDRSSPFDSYDLPIAPFEDGAVPTQGFEGRVDRQTWRIDGVDATTLQLINPLRSQILDAGFDVVFECKDRVCGGFDFRFLTEVIPAPDMYVDIRNYRFLAAIKDDEVISLLVSLSRTAAYVQVIQVSTGLGAGLQTAPGDRPSGTPVSPKPGNLGDQLTAVGHMVLGGVEFGSGSTALAVGPYPVLEQLAVFLRDNPQAKIALVGHTDSVGALDENIALSKARAGAVRQRMIEAFAIEPNRIDAEGMGYLAPVASNLTQAGREENRRVEVILLSLK